MTKVQMHLRIAVAVAKSLSKLGVGELTFFFPVCDTWRMNYLTMTKFLAMLIAHHTRHPAIMCFPDSQHDESLRRFDLVWSSDKDKQKSDNEKSDRKQQPSFCTSNTPGKAFYDHSSAYFLIFDHKIMFSKQKENVKKLCNVVRHLSGQTTLWWAFCSFLSCKTHRLCYHLRQSRCRYDQSFERNH